MKNKPFNIILPLVLLTIMLGFIYLILQLRQRNPEIIQVQFEFGQPQKNRIAVLFFNNLSANTEESYMSDGLTEDIITRLAKIEGLNVKSLTDVIRFKNKPATIREIGKTLEVDAVLEGSFRKQADTLLVTAQLIDVATGLHIWAERYERKISLEDIFGLQNELATKIAQAAHLTLTQSTKKNLIQKPTVSVEAQELYYKGKYYHLQMTDEGNYMAIEFFQKATELDPHFALAYAGLGNAFAHHYHMVEPKDKFWLDRAQEQIRKALSLDENLPEAHEALGHCYEQLDDDASAAEEYQKALTLKPDFMEAKIALGQVLCSMGKYKDALEKLHSALESNPEFAYIYYAIACVFSMQGKKDEAMDWMRKAFEHGFDNLYLMKKDAFLDPLRKDTRFIKWVKELGKGKDVREEKQS